MVLELLPILIPNIIEFLTLVRSISAEEVSRARGQAESDFDKSLANLVYRLDVWLYGRMYDNTYSSMFVFNGAIQMESKTLGNKGIIALGTGFTKE